MLGYSPSAALLLVQGWAGVRRSHQNCGGLFEKNGSKRQGGAWLAPNSGVTQAVSLPACTWPPSVARWGERLACLHMASISGEVGGTAGLSAHGPHQWRGGENGWPHCLHMALTYPGSHIPLFCIVSPNQALSSPSVTWRKIVFPSNFFHLLSTGGELSARMTGASRLSWASVHGACSRWHRTTSPRSRRSTRRLTPHGDQPPHEAAEPWRIEDVLVSCGPRHHLVQQQGLK